MSPIWKGKVSLALLLWVENQPLVSTFGTRTRNLPPATIACHNGIKTFMKSHSIFWTRWFYEILLTFSRKITWHFIACPLDKSFQVNVHYWCLIADTSCWISHAWLFMMNLKFIGCSFLKKCTSVQVLQLNFKFGWETMLFGKQCTAQTQLGSLCHFKGQTKKPSTVSM